MLIPVADHVRYVSTQMKQASVINNLKGTWDTWMKKTDLDVVDRIKNFVDKSKGQLKRWFQGDPEDRQELLKALPEVTKILKPMAQGEKLILMPDTNEARRMKIPPMEVSGLKFEIA